MNRLESAWNQLLERTDYEKCERPRAARFTLDGVRGLVSRLGDPQDACPVLHVAGSKGKGSTCHYLERGLRAAGRRTGLYTSPHLTDWRDRILVDGARLDDARYADALHAALEAGTGEETFFDLLTAAAFVAFRDARCEVAVIEVGLGGRYDSTNVVQPLAAAVVSVELEHVEVLGSDRARIAEEKAGVYKRGAAMWCGAGIPEEARAVLRRAAEEVGGVLQEPDVEREARAFPHPHPPLRASFALARAMLRSLPTPLYRASEALADLDARALMLPGRWETRRTVDGRRVVLDVAHSEESMRAVLATFRAAYPDAARGVVFALREEKDAAALAEALGPIPEGETWWAAPAGDHPRSHAPTTIGEAFHARVLDAPELPQGPDVLLVTGSTYLVGALRPRTREDAAGATP